MLDAGGFARGHGQHSKLQTEYVLKGMSMLDYAAINLTQRDFGDGVEFMSELKSHGDIPLISANIFDPQSGENFAEPFHIEKVDIHPEAKNPPFRHLKIGIIGLTEPRDKLILRGDPEKNLTSTDPVPEAQKYVKKLSGKADLIAVLFNGRFNTLQSIIENVTGIDVIIMGGEYYRIRQLKDPEPIVVSSPSLGKYASSVTLVLNGHKNIVSHEANRYPLNEKIPDDPEMSKLVKRFNQARQQQ